MLSPVLGYECNLLTQSDWVTAKLLGRYNIIPSPVTYVIWDPLRTSSPLTCLKQMNHLFDQPTKLFRKQNILNIMEKLTK